MSDLQVNNQDLPQDTIKNVVEQDHIYEQLLDVITKQDFEKVKLTLDSFYDVGGPPIDFEGTALLTAAKTGNAQIFESLLIHEATLGVFVSDLEINQDLCQDIIKNAVEQGHIGILRSLFKLEKCIQHIKMDVYQNADEQIQRLLYSIIQKYKCYCWCSWCPPHRDCPPRCPYKSVCIKCATNKYGDNVPEESSSLLCSMCKGTGIKGAPTSEMLVMWRIAEVEFPHRCQHCDGTGWEPVSNHCCCF